MRVTTGGAAESADFLERVRANQLTLTAQLRARYDFIVCGAGSAGSVVARRLAENPEVSVLLLEAGGSDDAPSIREASQWPLNLGSEHDWNFVSEPDLWLNGRTMPMNMGKVLGGGSSINVMCWARGHKNDWDFFATEAGDAAWGYEAVSNRTAIFLMRIASAGRQFHTIGKPDGSSSAVRRGGDPISEPAGRASPSRDGRWCRPRQ